MISAIVESQIVRKSIVTVTAEERPVEVNATAQIVTIAQVSQIWKKTQILSLKRG
jgi:hypothetical protein